MKPTLIASTPVTRGMEMFNYLNEKPRKLLQNNYPKRSYDNLIKQLAKHVLDELLTNVNEKSKQLKLNLVYAYYKFAL